MRTVRFILVLGALAAALTAVISKHWDDRGVEEAALATRLAAKGLSLGQPVFIRLFKQDSELELWVQNKSGWRLFQTYPICRWSGGLGPKLKTGDRQAPEGFYRVGLAQLNPNSRWHRSFNIGFPNEYDRAHGRTGSYLMVHGGCSSAGCYAMTNAKVDDIYRLVEAALKHGQPTVDVHAFPFRMTDTNMALHGASKWTGFWRDLKRGYDLFEATREVPLAGVSKGRYVVFAAGASLRPQTLISAWR